MSSSEDEQREAEFENWNEDTNGGTLHRYIGISKPKVDHRKEHYARPGLFEDSDNMPSDPEQAGWEKING